MLACEWLAMMFVWCAAAGALARSVSEVAALGACGNPADLDCDGLPNGVDRCPFFGSPDQSDSDADGIGNVCECGDQNGDGSVNVSDLVAINLAVFDPSRVTPLCDTNDDGLCNVADIVGANRKIFGQRAYCSRYPAPRNDLVIGTHLADILRAPTRLLESAMGNMMADALRLAYPGAQAALINSGALRADLRLTPPSAGEQPGEITWGEMFAVLPFGNLAVIETLTGAQLETALENGFSPVCNPGVSTGRFPQISGLRVLFECNGPLPRIVGMWKTIGQEIPIGPADPVRIVTNDFMFTGGDGYTVLAQGTDVEQLGHEVLRLATEYVTAHSPVFPVVEGRITRR
jgi:hypothetical protein